MGPFVPDLITDEMNLIVALFIGIAFGFVLEQAGFSSSRRLAGLFYGYDFTVLRVFFTAGVTAMSGVLLLGYFGLLDLDAIYINPLWLWPAIAGGIIMGVGFILGGYCPGTSVCAAAIGKIDGMVFVLGGIAGAFLFAEAYPMYESFYAGSFLGPVKVFASLGISQGLFAFALIVVAVGAFFVTTLIEKKVNPSAPSKEFPKRTHFAAAGVVILLGVVFLFLPDRKETMIGEVSTASYAQSHPVKEMTVDELAFRIIDRDPSLQVIDIRNEQAFTGMPVPGAVNIPVEKMFGKEWIEYLGPRHKQKVFISDDGDAARTAVLLAGRLGYENLFALRGGYREFSKTILNAAPFVQNVAGGNDVTQEFRARAATAIAQMIKDAKAGGAKAPKLAKKIKGGC